MRAGNSRSRGTQGWRKSWIAADVVASFIAGSGLKPVGEGEPVGGIVYLDGKGRQRRVRWWYADGWTATVYLRLDGSQSFEQSFSLRLKVEARS